MDLINLTARPYIHKIATVGLGAIFLFTTQSCRPDPAPRLPGTAGGPTIIDTVPTPYHSSKDSISKHEAASMESNVGIIRCEAVYDSAYQWGYRIYMGKQVFIDQKTIPSISGNQGFATKSAALKTALFVTWKLSNNIMPPTVTERELDSLHVIQAF